MSKNHKITYAVNEDKTSMIVVKETDKVSDVLHKIQTKEDDEEYKHLFVHGSEIDPTDFFKDYYEPQAVYIATKKPEIPLELQTIDGDSDDEKPVKKSKTKSASSDESDSEPPKKSDAKSKKPKSKSSDESDSEPPKKPNTKAKKSKSTSSDESSDEPPKKDPKSSKKSSKISKKPKYTESDESDDEKSKGSDSDIEILDPETMEPETKGKSKASKPKSKKLDSDDETPVKKISVKKPLIKKKTVISSKKVSSSSSDSDDENIKKPTKKAKKISSDSDEDSSDKKKPVKKSPLKSAKPSKLAIKPIPLDEKKSGKKKSTKTAKKSSSSSSDSDDEKPSPAAKKKPGKTTKKSLSSDSDSDDEKPSPASKKKPGKKILSSDSDSDEKYSPAAKKKSTKTAKKSSSSSSDSDDEKPSPASKKKPGKKILSSDSDSDEKYSPAAKKKPGKPTKKSLSSDSDSDDKKPSSAAKKKPAKKALSSDSDSVEEKPSPAAKKKPGKKTLSSDSDSDEKSSPAAKKKPTKKISSSDSDDEKPSSSAKKKPVKKGTSKPVKKSTSDSDSDSSDKPPISKKKSNPKIKVPPPKKPKLETDSDSKSGSDDEEDRSPKSSNDFTVYTTLTYESISTGHKVKGITDKMELDDVKKTIVKFIKNDKNLKSQVKGSFEVHLFLPCGVPFLSGTFKEFESSIEKPIQKVLYAIVTRDLESTETETYKQPCDCSSDEMKLLLSPLNDSTIEGYTQIACLLGFFFYGGSLPQTANLLRKLATLTGFAPMITSLYTIMSQKKVTGMMIASITCCLQTLIQSKVTDLSQQKLAFSYTNPFISYVSCTKLNKCPVPNLIVCEEQDEDDGGKPTPLQEYLKDHEHTGYTVLWDKDMVLNKKCQFKLTKLQNATKKKLNESYKSDTALKPVSPMSLLYLHSVSFVRTQKPKTVDGPTKVGLFIRKKPTEGNDRNVLFINPEKSSNMVEIDYEDLATKIGDDSIDDKIKSKGDTSLQQIVLLLLDTSISMRNLLNGKSKRAGNKEPSRKELSLIFLRALMKRIHDFKIPTARGLLLFGDQNEMKYPLSIAEKDFEKAIKDIKVGGVTHLWDAIDEASDEIIKFNPSKTVNGEKVFKYPEATQRIILLSDANDTESEKSEAYRITEKLVKNRIILDVIMISTAEECRDALIASKITGGLSFRPEDSHKGVELFENEAFLNINARADLTPIEGKINEKVFTQNDKELGKNPYTDPNEIKNSLIKKATANSPLLSVERALYNSKKDNQPKSICEISVIRQLNRVKKRNDPNVAVYVFKNDITKWRVFLKGPDRSPYSDSWWNLFVSFPPSYPSNPPQFRFITVPYHQNVSAEGLLLFSQISDGYEPQMKMPQLLQAIRSLLKKPDDQYCLRRSLMDEREGNEEDFKRNAKASKTAYAVDDYTEFLDDAKVEDEVPDGGSDDSDESGGGDDDDDKDGSDDVVGGDEAVFMTIVRPDGRKLITSSDDEIEVDDD